MTFDQNGQIDLENSHGLAKGQMQKSIKYIAQWRIQIDIFWLAYYISSKLKVDHAIKARK